MKFKFFMVLAAVAVASLWAGDALAGPEDQAISVIERVLDVIADFLAKVFQSIADAVKSVWTPSKD